MLLELAGSLGVKSLLVMSHVVLVTHRALVVLVVVVLLLLSGLAHVSVIVAPVTVVVLVRLLVDIGVLLATIHTVVWRLRGWPLNLQLSTGIQNLKNVKFETLDMSILATGENI